MTFSAEFPITLEQSLLLRDLLIYYISSLDSKIQAGATAPYIGYRICAPRLLNDIIVAIKKHQSNQEFIQTMTTLNRTDILNSPEAKDTLSTPTIFALETTIDILQNEIAPLLDTTPSDPSHITSLTSPSFGLSAILFYHDPTTITTLQTLLQTLSVIPFSRTIYPPN